jgi:hypothetical protein
MGFAFEVVLLRDSALTFPSSPMDVSIESLRIWHCKYRSVQRLTDFSKLAILEIASYPDDTLDAIGELRQLRYLRILHLPKVSSLAPLGNLRKLRTLALETTPGWDSSNRVTEVESLEPLSRLPMLEHLALLGIRPRDRSLRPLQASGSLRSVRVHKYPPEEVVRFFRETGWKDVHVPEPDDAVSR